MFLLPILLVAQGLVSFAFDLSKPLQSGDQNSVYSPLSISTTLGMCAIGSKDKTYDEIRHAMHFEGSQEQLGEEFKTLLTDIKSKDDSFPNLLLNLETVLWMQKNDQFLPLYQSEVVKNFFGQLRAVDFTKSGEAAFEINRWFFEESGGLMGALFGPDEISPSARLIALSTLYLKAFFEKPFESSHTRVKPFHVKQDKNVSMDLMYQKNVFPYYKGEDFEVVEMNYLPLAKEFALWIILPKSIDRFTFDQNIFNNVRSQLKPEMVELQIPRFRIESSINLIPALKQLGIKQAFDTSANFSLMSEANNLMIGDFKHRALIIVDEGGTTAEAATSATFVLKALPPQTPIQFVADHPFLFLILDKKNSNILFMGRVIEPKVLISRQTPLSDVISDPGFD